MGGLRGVTRSLLAPAALAAVTACGSDDPTSPMRTGSLIVTPDRLVLGLGLSRRLSASVRDEDGDPVPGAAVSFESSDVEIASVTADGLVGYIGVGHAEITATSGDLSAVVPYTGLRSGHPLGAAATSATLPGVVEGDGPFGAAVDESGRILITQTHGGRLASSSYPVTGFVTREVDGTPTSIALLAGGTALVTPTGADNDDASIIELSSDRSMCPSSPPSPPSTARPSGSAPTTAGCSSSTWAPPG
jgi:hypothetical protein